ncbi:patatin [Lysobacter helvus]|uniref:Patatin n=2 Tax=Lysobacteraceae TaxID=32033 RepID=A0ABM7Q2Y1_9GAMM|nr:MULTISPECIES: patatin-like phospholipase family protein [Lysobacter]BCT91561.1 patatin [Lysobacter caseinilyticus]BCT94714.1 patatin [Lysobacter helvus]
MLLLGGLFTSAAFAQSTSTTTTPAPATAPATPACGTRAPGDTRPRIGLALGGGGARGIAHVAILREIEARHIPIDCIAGTSMGALVGGLYASGMSVDDMEHLVTSTDWKRLFDDSIERPERTYRRKQDDRDALATVGVGIGGPRGLKLSPGVLQGERILAMFEQATLGVSRVEHFDQLPIPFRAVATDLNTGDPVVLDHGSLAMAMRASMSLPGIFQPVEIGGHVLIDGGVADQVPIDVLRTMGADVLIAVDVGTPLEKLDRDASLLQVVSQMTGMLTTGNTRRMLATMGEGDVLIVPDLGTDVATSDFDKAKEALAIGARAAEAARPRLARLAAKDDAAYRTAIAQRPVFDNQPPIIEFVRLDNQTDYADAMLLAQLDIDIGKPLDAAKVEEHVLRVYGFGTMASVTYEVVEENGRTGIVVSARPKPQGPNYLQLGLTLSNDFQGGYDSNLRMGLLFAPLSPFGAEARVVLQIGSEPGLSAEYYHPFDIANRYLLHAEAAYANPNIRVYDSNGHNTATYDVATLGVELQVAREFGNYGTAGFGLERGSGHASVQTGDPAVPFNFDTGRLSAFVSIDRLDSLFFPRNGYGTNLAYTIARDWLGSDSEYAQLDFDVLAAKSFGRSAIQGGVGYHATTQGTLPVQDRYRLGGRGQLVGFRQFELTGQDYAVVYGGYTWQLAEVFGRSALVGGTLEYGNAWEKRSDMDWADGIWNASLYIGFDSWVGPMLFGYGWREGGNGVLFLEIGKPF